MCYIILDVMEFVFMDKIKQEIALKENQVQILQDKITYYEKKKKAYEEKLKMLSKQLQSVLGR